MRFTRTWDKILFIDTSAFVAIANEGDIWHSDSAKFLDDIKNGKTMFRTLVFGMAILYISKKFRINFSPSSVNIDSGWNCTP
jgi:predicted nucleic acid-binding protein